MTKINAIYKCKICGNIVEMVHTGAGELVCCGQPMEIQEEKNQTYSCCVKNGERLFGKSGKCYPPYGGKSLY